MVRMKVSAAGVSRSAAVFTSFSIGQWGMKHLPADGPRPYVSHDGHEIDPKVSLECRTCGERLA